MVEYKDGNVMDNAIGILAYPVNTRGAMEDEMGTQIKITYPKVFQMYSHTCSAQKRRNLGGKADIIACNARMFVAVMYVRTRNYGEGVDYYCFRQALTRLRDYAERRHLSVCMPMFGNEKERATMRDIIEDLFSASAVPFTVWIADHQVIGLPPRPAEEGEKRYNDHRPEPNETPGTSGKQGQITMEREAVQSLSELAG